MACVYIVMDGLERWRVGDRVSLYTPRKFAAKKGNIYIYIYIYIDTKYLTLSLSLRKSDKTQMSERDLRGLH